MQKQFYVSHNAKDLGPFTREEISMKLQKKELFPSDFIYIEQKEDWVLLEEFVGGKSSVAPVHVSQTMPEKTVTKTVTDVKFEDLAYGKSPSAASNHVEHKAAHKHNTVRFDKGEAKVAVHNEKVGTLTIAVDSKKLGLAVETRTEIKFVAGAASQIHWDAPSDVVVGQSARLSFRALDKFGNLDTRFEGSIRLESAHKVDGLGVVQFKAGLAHKDVRWTKAEAVEFKISAQTPPNLECKKTCKVNFKAAPAAKILIESKNEAHVGEEVYVTVRAVDAYGNLDSNFNEAVTLHLSGVQSKDAEVRLNQGMGTFKVS